MADYMLRDRLRDLWQLIDEVHLSYLHADESPHKIEEKKRLEGHIKDYLSIAPHESKFCFRETSQVLHNSVEGKDDFSAYKATVAWTAIAGYAHNLLAQPWRKEFREIKMYCGFFKHHVEGSLIGGELMLEMMGYRAARGSTMILEGPVDPDRVASVSKDSIVALVECQIMRIIYGDLVKTIGDCTWLDVLQYRETHVGTPEQALHGLTYRLHQRRYQEQYNTVDGYNRYQNPLDTCSYVPRYCRYAPAIPHGYVIPSQLSYGALISPQQQLPPVVPPSVSYTSNGYYNSAHNGFSSTVPASATYSCSVPTGQLIELDAPFHKENSPHSYSGNTHKRSSSDHVMDTRERFRSNNIDDYVNRGSSKTKEEGWDSWGYVYQTLENKKSSYKENDFSQPAEKKQVSLLDLDEALKAFSIDSSHNLSVSVPVDKKIEEKKSVNLDFSGSTPVSTQTLGREVLKKNNESYLTLRVKLNDKWECSTCTFHNPEGKEVCEMCGKSKRVGNEAQPLTSGGRQCPKCTLVNEKGVTKCDACETCLKNSPTYI